MKWIQEVKLTHVKSSNGSVGLLGLHHLGEGPHLLDTGGNRVGVWEILEPNMEEPTSIEHQWDKNDKEIVRAPGGQVVGPPPSGQTANQRGPCLNPGDKRKSRMDVKMVRVSIGPAPPRCHFKAEITGFPALLWG